MNLQDNFLNVARKENAELEITLVTGKTFKGHVKGFDNFTVIVFSGDKQNMIYKHAIAHIQMDKTNPKLEIKPYTSARKPTQRSEKKSKAPEKEQEKEKFNSIDFSNVKLQND